VIICRKGSKVLRERKESFRKFLPLFGKDFKQFFASLLLLEMIVK
jgi:hypothetical protein